jgi:hypothetical protein
MHAIRSWCHAVQSTIRSQGTDNWRCRYALRVSHVLKGTTLATERALEPTVMNCVNRESTITACPAATGMSTKSTPKNRMAPSSGMHLASQLSIDVPSSPY